MCARLFDFVAPDTRVIHKPDPLGECTQSIAYCCSCRVYHFSSALGGLPFQLPWSNDLTGPLEMAPLGEWPPALHPAIPFSGRRRKRSRDLSATGEAKTSTCGR